PFATQTAVSDLTQILPVSAFLDKLCTKHFRSAGRRLACYGQAVRASGINKKRGVHENFKFFTQEDQNHLHHWSGVTVTDRVRTNDKQRDEHCPH
ncbi:MAG: hypothetical protein P8183_16615, partial [Anaerolineae bacterium]